MSSLKGEKAARLEGFHRRGCGSVRGMDARIFRLPSLLPWLVALLPLSVGLALSRYADAHPPRPMGHMIDAQVTWGDGGVIVAEDCRLLYEDGQAATVNGKPAASGTTVHEGDVIHIIRGPFSDPFHDTRINHNCARLSDRLRDAVR